MKKILSRFLPVVLAIALLMPVSNVFATPTGTYSISGVGSVLGTVATINGVASVEDNGVNSSNVHVGIDWNEDQSPVCVSENNPVGCGINISNVVELTNNISITCNKGVCSIVWGPTNHDYSSVGSGTYNI